MKIIARIARTELSTLFFSPIAWFILIVFSLLTAIRFATNMENTISWYDLNGYGTGNESLSYGFFLGPYGFLGSVVGNLYIYIPLLTMGLLSRETASGSIKLLYSSPVTSSQIVLGKYLAAIAFGLCLLLVPTAAALYGGCVIPHFDFPPVLVGLLGLYLLIAAYCAVGLFMSSLTSYQVVAAVGTLIVLAALKFVGHVGQNYDTVRELTYWLSINGRTGSMLQGVVRTEDLIYFLAVIALFLAFTVFRLSFARRTIGKLRQAAAYVGVFAAVMLTGYLTSRPGTVKVWDATRTKLNSLTENSMRVLEELKGPVTVTNYVNLLDGKSHRYLPFSMKQNETIFDPYCLSKPDMRVRYVYYYDRAADFIGNTPKFRDKSLEELRDYLSTVYNLNPRRFKSPEQIRKIEDLSGEQNTFVRVVEAANGNRAYIRDFNDMQSTPGEAEITAALKKMISTPPTVAFLTGHGEREVTRPGDRDYGNFSIEKYSRAALVNQGFDVTQIDLRSCAAIPEQIGLLVVADMKEPFTADEFAVVDAFIERGGNLFVLADAGRQQAMNPLLERFGLKMEEHQLAQPFGDFYPDLILSRATEAAGELSEGFRKDFRELELRVSMPGCVALTELDNDSGFRRIPLFQTEETGAWIEMEQADLKEGPVACNPSAGEREGRYITAYAAERQQRGRRQRVIVTGDADCMSNAELTMQREGYRSGNFDLIAEGFRYLTDGQFPIDVRRPENTDTRFSAGTEAVGPMKILFMFLLPAILLLAGVGLWLYRRRN
ncbi:Gldg family protein [Alistipes sp.]|uniref:Gldg family protein n=1 Tax=Alistipes sp. TaxID=1872444 RepID=UPI003AEFF04C